MNEIDIARHSRLIDPQLHIWGWEIPVYLFLGGLAAGLMILSSALMLRNAERSPTARWLAFTPVVLVSVGMGALFLDLAYKFHVWRFYLAFRWTSPMSWGAWILIVVYPVSLLVALAGLEESQVESMARVLGRVGLAPVLVRLRQLATMRARALCWANLVTGIALGVYTGILLSTLGARALWSSSLLGPLFLVSGFSSAAALLMLFRVGDEVRHLAARWDVIAIALELVLLALYLVGLGTQDAASRSAVHLLLGGAWTVQFWLLVVLAGLAVPLALEVIEGRLKLRPRVFAPLLVLVGGFALRWILVAAGQA